MHDSRRTYREGVAWIALNDNPGDAEGLSELAGYISVMLLGDIHGVDPNVVAADVLEYRESNPS
jgi:hypothetical protein